MLIGAVNKFTLLDYPEQIAAIIFTATCNFRCGYCHNSIFVLPEKIETELQGQFIPEDRIINFLTQRKNLLSGVVISGGEPTIQPDLPDFIRRIKALGYLVKLDTNGTNPQMLEYLLKENLVDFIAMDIKNSWEKYPELIGREINTKDLENSVELIKTRAPDYEFRSTILPFYHSLDNLTKMAEQIRGSKVWALQAFRNVSVLDNSFAHLESFSPSEMTAIQKELEKIIPNIIIR